MRFSACLAVLAAVLAAPAVQAQKKDIRFSIGTRDYAMTIPDAFCLPEGEMVVAAESVARTATSNFTLASLYRCDAEMIYTDRWLLIKTARNLPDMDLSERERWLPEWERFFAASEDGSLDGPIIEDAERAASEELGAELDIATSRTSAGRDGNCAYTLGQAMVRMGDARQKLRTAGWLCIGGDRAVSFRAYDNREGASSDELLERVKDFYAAVRLVR